LEISKEHLAVALQALQRPSQNNIQKIDSKKEGLDQRKLSECDEIMKWCQLPVNTKTGEDEYLKLMALK